MTTITLWLLISVGGSTRASTVIERFTTQLHCDQAKAQLDAAVRFPGPSTCIKVEAAR